MFIGIKDREYCLELAPIKPESVILPTVINLHFVLRSYYDGFHLFETDRALAFARLPILPFTQLRQQSISFQLAVYQQFDFTGI